MADPLLGIAVSGLTAAQAGLQTTGHNISNVNTPGYNRQTVVQTTNIPQYIGAGYLGRGVSVDTVQRSYSSFLQTQYLQAQSSSSQLQAFSDQVNQIDSLLGSSDTGLSTQLSSFFNAAQTVASSPSDTSARQNMLSQAQMLASSFQQLQGQFDSQRANVSNQLSDTVSQVNTLASQIAGLNLKILSSAGTGTQAPNDLLDQRDQLVSTLSTLVNVQVTTASDGSYNVLTGNGQPLVLETTANKLATMPGDPDTSQTQVVLQGAGGTVKLRDSDLSGGTIGGLLSFQDNALNSAENSLGRIAMTLASAVNKQNQLGQDLNGNLGSAIFSVGQPQVLPASGNSGSAVVSAAVTNYSALTTSDYQLSYDGTNYTVKRLSDGNVSSFTSLPQTVDGVSISVSSGTMAAGDSFLVEPTRNGASNIGVTITSPTQIAAALPIQTTTPSGNTGTLNPGSITISGPPVNANLQQPVTITFTSPTTFNVTGTGTGNPTGLTYTPGGTISYNGWTIQLSGAPAAGDTMTVTSNAGATGDNRNALALANLQNAALLNGGSASLGDAYAQLVSQVGNQAEDAKTSITAQSAVLSNVQQAIQGNSGVNLDEEASNLLRYQQAYQAAGKVISIAETLFQTILSLGT